MRMASASAWRSGRNEYLVWDLEGDACSVLLNLELAGALKKLARRRSARQINAILLGHIEISEWNRALVTIEDCDVIPLPEQFSEHLEYWRGEEAARLSAVGLMRVAPSGIKDAKSRADPRDESIAFFNRHFAGLPGVLLLIEPTSHPLGRLLWNNSSGIDSGTAWSEILLDTAKPGSGEFTILQGSPVAEYRTTPAGSGRRALRRWAWAPLAAALLCITALTFWAGYRPMPKEVVAQGAEPQATPPAEFTPEQPLLQATPTPKPPRVGETLPRPRFNRERRERPPNPSTVTVELHSAPDSIARRLINRVPGMPLAFRFRSKDTASFVAASPVIQVKPTVPTVTARAFPEEVQVNFRVTIDKSGHIVRTTLLNRGANPKFVDAAKTAINRWRFRPARLRKRSVPSALDVTFRFHNSGRNEGERAKR